MSSPPLLNSQHLKHVLQLHTRLKTLQRKYNSLISQIRSRISTKYQPSYSETSCLAQTSEEEKKVAQNRSKENVKMASYILEIINK